MATIKCPKCEADIADSEKRCPGCGFPILEAPSTYQEFEDWQDTADRRIKARREKEAANKKAEEEKNNPPQPPKKRTIFGNLAR